MTLETSRNSSTTSALRTNSSATRRKSPARRSKLQSQSARPERPARDDLCNMISDYLTEMNEHMTLKEMSEKSWVFAATISRYKNNRGRYLRSDSPRVP